MGLACYNDADRTLIDFEIGSFMSFTYPSQISHSLIRLLYILHLIKLFFWELKLLSEANKLSNRTWKYYRSYMV